MKSMADGLPPDIAAQIHPDWRKNEAEYWAVRDQLLVQYTGQWVAFADGAVIAASRRAVEVFHAARQSGQHPFVIRVGHEQEPLRIRRASFAYDAAYVPDALPVVQVEFRLSSGSPGMLLDRVIPDTGADTSVLPLADCQRLQLDPALGMPSLMGGVGGAASMSLTYSIWAWLDGREYVCTAQADFAGHDRILGREVLNCLEILFRGPAGEVVVNP